MTNPYSESANLLKAARDMYWFLGDLNGFAHFHGKYFETKKKAQVWEMTALISRPLQWDGGR